MEQSEWTPGESSFVDDSSFSETELIAPSEDCAAETYNEAMEKLCTKLPNEKFRPLEHALNKTWENATKEEKKTCVETAKEGCRIICKVIATRGSEELFQAVKQPTEDTTTPELLSLMTAYKNAPTKKTENSDFEPICIQIFSKSSYESARICRENKCTSNKEGESACEDGWIWDACRKNEETSCIHGYGESEPFY